MNVCFPKLWTCLELYGLLTLLHAVKAVPISVRYVMLGLLYIFVHTATDPCLTARTPSI